MDASCGFTRLPVGARSVSGKDVLGHPIIINQSEEVTIRGGVQSPRITALETPEGSQSSATPQLSAEPPPSCTAAPLRGPATTPRRGLPDRLQPRRAEGEGGRESQPSIPGEEEKEGGVVGRVGLRQDPACLYPGG